MISQLKEAIDGGQRTGGHRGSVAMAEVAIERETEQTKGGFEAPSAAPSIRPPKLAAKRAAPRRRCDRPRGQRQRRRAGPARPRERKRKRRRPTRRW